jgi:hypothetical protein
VSLHAIEQTRFRGQRRVDGVESLHAIEQAHLRIQRRVDGVRRPKFDFHTETDVRLSSEIRKYFTVWRDKA